jgi:hypothetical protein
MSRLLPEENLLKDLDAICDYVVGNEAPTDVSYNERSTLPESLAHLMLYPTSMAAVKDAQIKMKKLSNLIDTLNKKIKLMYTKNEVKLKKY